MPPRGTREAPGEPACLPGPGSLAALTAEETVRYTRQLLVPPAVGAVAELGELVSCSVYSPRPALPGDATVAWSAQRRLRSAVGAAIGPRGRLRRALELPRRYSEGVWL
jgi:hypothetical protein